MPLEHIRLIELENIMAECEHFAFFFFNYAGVFISIHPVVPMICKFWGYMYFIYVINLDKIFLFK